MRSITLKLFLMTTVVFSLLIGGMMLIQSVFFEDYYVQQKTVSIISVTENITKLFESSAGSQNEVNEAVASYASKNGISVFYNENADDTADSEYSFKMGSVVINSNMAFQQDFFAAQIKYGKTLYEQNKPYADAGEIIEYQTQDTYGNTIICTVNSVVEDGQNQGILHTFTSLQPIGEAASVIRDYYPIFFAVALVLTAALSILYSRQIAKPMLHINRVAGKIAKLDFTEECTYRSKDELGHLSSTINTLSANLSSTIKQLEESNKRLKSELKNAKKLEQQRKEFIAGVSHELKTPLSVMRGYVEKLTDEMPEDAESRQEAASVIISESEKMDRLVSGMLDLSSLEAGAVALDKTAVSLDRIIRYILKMKSDEIAQKNITVDYTPDKELLAYCDAFRIEQVLSNLLCNAIQYTPAHGYIIIRATYDSGNEVLCEIENGEAHIPQSEIEDIWNHFHRIEKSRNKKYGGAGLGLSIVKQILELHGSRFGVKNTETGVLFYFTLPHTPLS